MYVSEFIKILIYVCTPSVSPPFEFYRPKLEVSLTSFVKV